MKGQDSYLSAVKEVSTAKKYLEVCRLRLQIARSREDKPLLDSLMRTMETCRYTMSLDEIKGPEGEIMAGESGRD
eukprot:275928-Hanusia_phi.AAC.1